MNSTAGGSCPHSDYSRAALEQREVGFPTGRSAGQSHCGPCDPSSLLPQCCSGPQSSCLHLQYRPVVHLCPHGFEPCWALNVKPSVLSLVQKLFGVHESKTFEKVRPEPEGKASGEEVVQGTNCSIGHLRETSWASVPPHTSVGVPSHTRAEGISSRARRSLHIVPSSLHTQPLAGMVSVHTHISFPLSSSPCPFSTFLLPSFLFPRLLLFPFFLLQ